ncbi:hypothetical protein PR048_024588 [Dryococelus australis]|uniref:Uncharacterized protein n=1 Tax=Dryococelus australis TaxID=614101 RepID=A0ABQ9GP05_9NEOP|nr:hypothetical protein PR048_024588 [Dryococelus australis]
MKDEVGVGKFADRIRKIKKADQHAMDAYVNDVSGELGKFKCLVKDTIFRESVESAVSIIEADQCALDEKTTPTQCRKKQGACCAFGSKQQLAKDCQKSSSSKNNEQLN